MLQLIGKVSKKSLVKQTYAIFSTCDTKEIMREITPEAIDAIAKFHDKKPENKGALLDLEHSINDSVFDNITSPALIIHSKEDKAVPFDHAKNTKDKIKNAEIFVANTWDRTRTIRRSARPSDSKGFSVHPVVLCVKKF